MSRVTIPGGYNGDTIHEGSPVSKRFPIKLPPWHEKRLIWWAAAKGASKTQIAQNALQAKIEANETQIEAMIAERAADRGIPPEAYKAALLEAAGWDGGGDDVDGEGIA